MSKFYLGCAEDVSTQEIAYNYSCSALCGGVSLCRRVMMLVVKPLFMQPIRKNACLALAVCCLLYACNKNDHKPSPNPTPTPTPTPIDSPAIPPPPPPQATVCIPLTTASLPGWQTTGFWLDGVLQFEPKLVEMKDTAGYWLMTGNAGDNERLYIAFKKAPAKSWLYYRVHGFPLSTWHDSCAVAIAYQNGTTQLVWHPLHSPDAWDSDKVPVHVTDDSIYVSFEYSAGASTGGAPYKIAGRMKGKRNF